MSRRLDCSLHYGQQSTRVDASFWNMKLIPILFDQLFLARHTIVKVQHPPYSQELAHFDFSCFQKWNFISTIRIKDIFTQYQKRSFGDASTNGKLTGISVSNPMKYIDENATFTVLVNSSSVSTHLEYTLYYENNEHFLRLFLPW